MSAPGYALELARDQVAWARASHDSMKNSAAREQWDGAVQNRNMRDLYLARAVVFMLSWALDRA